MSDLDLALERLHRTAPEFGPGLANHGPMVCEALSALGQEALIPAYLERYAARLPPLPAGRPIPVQERAAALGRSPARTPDWIASFERPSRNGPGASWAEAASALAAGLFASAAHGWLRSAQAARALAGDDSPLRRRELAHGLDLWAARYRELPGTPGRVPAGRGRPRLADAPVVDPAARRSGLFSDAAGMLAGPGAFAAWVDGLDLGAAARDLLRAGQDLSRRARRRGAPRGRRRRDPLPRGV